MITPKIEHDSDIMMTSLSCSIFGVECLFLYQQKSNSSHSIQTVTFYDFKKFIYANKVHF